MPLVLDLVSFMYKNTLYNRMPIDYGKTSSVISRLMETIF
jgi:hypothetical protein